ncbi:FGGY-family carbohydrate kinase [Cobetia marina]
MHHERHLCHHAGARDVRLRHRYLLRAGGKRASRGRGRADPAVLQWRARADAAACPGQFPWAGQPQHPPANLCRATMEGASYGLCYALECMGPLGSAARQIRLVGGGAKSPLWRQMLADILDLEVVCPQVTEAAALGAAIQAGWCLRQRDAQGEGQRSETLKALCDRLVALDLTTHTQPQPEGVAAYRKGYADYRALLASEHGIPTGG